MQKIKRKWQRARDPRADDHDAVIQRRGEKAKVVWWLAVWRMLR